MKILIMDDILTSSCTTEIGKNTSEQSKSYPACMPSCQHKQVVGQPQKCCCLWLKHALLPVEGLDLIPCTDKQHLFNRCHLLKLLAWHIALWLAMTCHQTELRAELPVSLGVLPQECWGVLKAVLYPLPTLISYIQHLPEDTLASYRKQLPLSYGQQSWVGRWWVEGAAPSCQQCSAIVLWITES